ncbi:MAG TPA: hypothetical protein VI953_03040 [Candidatus Paceibacterota bacterium]
MTALAFKGLVDNAIGLSNPLVGIIIGLALLYFLYGVAQFILAAGNEEKVKEGRETMMWGIIALFAMVALWGLANLVLSTFGLNDSSTVSNFI